MMNFWTKTLGWVILALFLIVTVGSFGAGMLTFWLSTVYYIFGTILMICVWLTLIGTMLNKSEYRTICSYTLVLYSVGVLAGYIIF